MNERPITSEFELYEELRKLINRIRSDSIRPSLLHALEALSEQVMGGITHSVASQPTAPSPAEERRHSFRVMPQAQGIIVHGEHRLPVEILDLDGRGFGILSDHPLPNGELILLETDTTQETEIYSCFVAFCRQKENKFRIGVRVVAKLPNGMA